MQSDRRIIVLTEGMSNDQHGKTAVSVIRYNTEAVVAILDSTEAGRTSQDLFECGGDIPVVADLQAVSGVNTLLIGIAPPGGQLPPAWRPIICQALISGLDIISGMHDFLSDDEEFRALAQEHHAKIWDVRKNTFKQVATAEDFDESCFRVHTVGHDCSVGKMVTSLEINKAFVQRGLDSSFVATGQTGMMITGSGLPIDCVVSDFLNGAAEELVRTHQQHDIMVIEGQGSILQPLYSPVTLGLLHGCRPDALILCYATHRKQYLNTQRAIPPLNEFVVHYESIASAMHPCSVVGVAMNSRGLSAAAYEEEKKRVMDDLELPVVDVIRDDASVLADALLRHKERIGK